MAKNPKLKLVSYQIRDNQLILNVTFTNQDFSTEFAADFLGNNLKKFTKEIAKLIDSAKINFRSGKIKLLVNGTLLSTFLLAAGTTSGTKNAQIVQVADQPGEELDFNIEYPGESITTEEHSINVAVPDLKLMKIALIAGHGQSDPGAVSNNRHESVYAQELVNMVKQELLARNNINVEIVTETTPGPLNEEISFLKKVDVDYALSIHFNAGGGSGTEMIVPYDYSDFTIAQEIINNFKTFKQPIRPTSLYSKSADGKTVRKNGVITPSQRDYYGIIRTGTQKNIQSEILEVEFIDNESNMSFYDSNKTKYATAIADAIATNYLKNFSK